MAYGYDSKNGIANTVSRWRKVADLTQGELAELVGTSRRTIALIESGETNPSIALAMRIAAELGRPVESLWAFHEGQTDEEGKLTDLPDQLIK
jgi:putative transcriptional regulator